MTVRVDQDAGVIELTGRCGAEDAEILQRHLLASPNATVKWETCEHLHAAVIQVLLVSRSRLQGMPRDTFLATHIAPILGRLAK
jgi:hypothetical protein